MENIREVRVVKESPRPAKSSDGSESQGQVILGATRQAQLEDNFGALAVRTVCPQLLAYNPHRMQPSIIIIRE
jgi:hypothetical protein